MKKFSMFAVVCAASLFVGCGPAPTPPAKTAEAATTPAATSAAPATTTAEPAKTEEKK